MSNSEKTRLNLYDKNSQSGIWNILVLQQKMNGWDIYFLVKPKK